MAYAFNGTNQSWYRIYACCQRPIFTVCTVQENRDGGKNGFFFAGYRCFGRILSWQWANGARLFPDRTVC